MKLRPIAELNARGLDTPSKKFSAASRMLRGATLPSPVATIIKPGIAAKAAIIGTGTAANPEFPAIPAVAAIKSPVVRPAPDWIGSVKIEIDSVTKIEHHTIYLPYSPAAEALGANLDASQILEITTPGFDLGAYVELGALPAPVAETALLINGIAATVEQYLYVNAQLLPAVAGQNTTIEKTLYKPTVSSPGIPCFKIEAYINSLGGSNDNVNPPS
jgi:hypothetical protein